MWLQEGVCIIGMSKKRTVEDAWGADTECTNNCVSLGERPDKVQKGKPVSTPTEFWNQARTDLYNRCIEEYSCH